MAAVATFHLLGWNSTTGTLAALVADRLRYRNVQGLRFLRVLGTGRGSGTAPGAQWNRTALFCLFDDDATAERFVDTLRPRRGLVESWHAKMHGAGGHGSWNGCEVPRILRAGMPPQPHTTTTSPPTASSSVSPTAPQQPLAVITRAHVRLRSWRTFSEAARLVDRELHQSSGLLGVVGIGEAPVLRLGTFSLWRNADAMSAFGHSAPLHAAVVERTRREAWYGEEMFARFVPYWSTGTWDGRDPLDGDSLRRDSLGRDSLGPDSLGRDSLGNVTDGNSIP